MFLVVPQRQRLLLCGAWFAVAVTWCQVILSVVVGSVFGPAPSSLVSWGRRPWDAAHLWSLHSACPVTPPMLIPWAQSTMLWRCPSLTAGLGSSVVWSHRATRLLQCLWAVAACHCLFYWRGSSNTSSCYLCRVGSLVSSCAFSSISVSPG